MIVRTSVDGRTLKKFITALLKSWFTQQIDRINYGQSYSYDVSIKKIHKTSIKLMMIHYDISHVVQLKTLIHKLSSICVCDIIVDSNMTI